MAILAMIRANIATSQVGAFPTVVWAAAKAAEFLKSQTLRYPAATE